MSSPKLPPIRRLARWAILLPAAILTSACGFRGPETPAQPDGVGASATVRPAATQQPPGTMPPNTSTSTVTTPTRDEIISEADFVWRSPDAQWIVGAFGYYPPIEMRVARADGSVTWEVESGGEGWFEVMLSPVHWSVDGRYLYFTLTPFVDGFVLYMDGSGLQRLDLSNGQVTEILAGQGELQAFSISPDSTQLAYVRNEEEAESIILRDLGTGEEQRWEVSSVLAQAGGITWSPDASALVLLVTRGFRWEEARTDLVLLNLRNHTRDVLLEDDPRIFYWIEWIDEHTLYLEDLTVTGWRLDLETGEMILTPTPRPTQQP